MKTTLLLCICLLLPALQLAYGQSDQEYSEPHYALAVDDKTYEIESLDASRRFDDSDNPFEARFVIRVFGNQPENFALTIAFPESEDADSFPITPQFLCEDYDAPGAPGELSFEIDIQSEAADRKGFSSLDCGPPNTHPADNKLVLTRLDDWKHSPEDADEMGEAPYFYELKGTLRLYDKQAKKWRTLTVDLHGFPM